MHKNLITLNLYSSEFYQVDNYNRESSFKSVKKYKRTNRDLIVSFIGNDDFLYEKVELNSNIPDSEILEVIKSNIYDELDNSLRYTILYREIKHKGSSDNRTFSVFIINPNLIKYISKQIDKRIGYIHNIYPLPLLLSTLYTYSGSSGKIEAYIYIYRDSSSLSIFQNGELLYTKGLTFSLLDFYEFFKDRIDGIEVSYKLFTSIITKQSILKKDFRYSSGLTGSLKYLFEEIKDILNYTKRNLNIDHIDQLFIGSEAGKILGSIEYSESLLNIETQDSILERFNIETNSQVADEMHIALLYAQRFPLPEWSYITDLQPPPNFFLRESGQLITVTALSVVLSLAYPLYNHYREYKILDNMEKKRSELLHYKSRYDKVHSVISSLEKEKIDIQQMLNRTKEEYNSKFDLLNRIHNKKVNYTLKGSTLYDITLALNMFKVSITKLQYIENNKKDSFKFLAVSEDDRKLTQLIEYLVKHFPYEVSITVINFEKIEGLDLYVSDITVGIN